MHFFVPDTNFFLQCSDYNMLDWSLVTDDLDITIAVPRVVQREIDSHKDGGNARRASRARRAWSIFAKVIDSGDTNRITTQVKSRKLSLELLMPKIRPEDFPDLDLQNDDDVVVAEALWVSRQQTAARVVFVSNDTPALMTAKSQNLPYLRPPQQWFLPPEKDERDKTIDELRRQVKSLTSQQPEVEFALSDHAGTPIECDVTLFAPLSDASVRTLMNEVRAQFPMQTVFPKEPPVQPSDPLRRIGSSLVGTAFQQWEPAGAGDIERYQKRHYPEWLRQIESDLRGLHQRLNEGLFIAVPVTLENKGQQPAKNVLVAYQAEGAIIFGVPASRADGDDEESEKPLLASPPPPPKGAYISLASQLIGRSSIVDVFSPRALPGMRDLSSLLQPNRHDPHDFYWKPRRPTVESRTWSLECNEFRHQHEPFSLDLVFRPEPMSQGEISAAVRCSAHASNLPARVELLIPVRIRVSLGDTMERAREELRFLCP
ncbi:hypothetical protein WJ07_16510 [Burkholderia vietnamiensis]|uniref:PIN domain-containing protein n=1 Tax=Burkholderia vietnamiensis TaxID=60552 RepID=A0AAW7SYN0_BURVI|nr:PIN domain-containing protein [Burkholderia vietnamiensis]KVF23101.1 hypothetical protein WJ07_16510 [Burkholderia vietnamiensis]KVG13232.1 hypothetical protein WJ24_04735 [Burkholderia vietnamiensis]MDN7796122.1 PIN domain-containing protein [Burkholderia vietnamiensis]HDR9189429.1 hypothetical protein [Burkholderia vietnamiensis]HDR9202325.1 hypothetical protein [Burkholderia vietnamiensis]